MRTFNFNTGFGTKITEQRIDEFLGTILVCSVLGSLVTKHAMSWWQSIQETRKNIWAAKAEAVKNRQQWASQKVEPIKKAAETVKEKINGAKESIKDAGKNMAGLLAFENALKNMPDGPQKDTLQKSLDNCRKIYDGTATTKEIEEVDKESQKQLPLEGERLLKSGRLDEPLYKIQNSPEGQKAMDKFVKAENDYWNEVMNTDDPKEIEEHIKKLEEQTEQIKKAREEREAKAKAEQEEKKDGEENKGEEKKDGEPKQIEDKSTKEPETTDKITPDSYEMNGGSEAENEKWQKVADLENEKNELVKKREEIQNQMAEEKDQAKKKELEDQDKELGEKIKSNMEATKEARKDAIETSKAVKNGEDPEEDDVQDGDERTDTDDQPETPQYGTNKEGKIVMKNDPARVYKQWTYKRGKKTFKSKSYHDKNGNTISKKDFMALKQAYDAAHAKGSKKKNESFGTFSFTRIGSKQIVESKLPVLEGATGDNRTTIMKERLVYIKYVMDTTKNNVEKVQMERMYNALYNLTFDSDGKVRSLDNLYSYINQTMTENKGKIEGLPTEEQVENIDKKVKAFKELDKSKYEAYLNRLDKELVDKGDSKSKDKDKAADLLHPAPNEEDSATVEKIRDLSTIYGFTNILGLEPERKASKVDVDRKDQVAQQQADQIKQVDSNDSQDVEADEISDKQLAKIMGSK